MRKTISAILLFVLLFALGAVAVSAETGYVNCDVLNVRVSPNTNSDIVTKLRDGNSFDIIYTDNGWYNIRMNSGVTGFVSAAYVEKGGAEASVGAKIADTAKQYVGCSYSYGSSGPKAFDCSGLTSYVYRQYGYSLPRSSVSQGSYGSYVSKSDIVAGDLLFFSNRSDRTINHVGIYVGDNKFVHASTSGRGVVVDNLTSSYYVNNYVTARRVL